MDNEREPEISEETLRLVRELGERLEEEDSDSRSMPRFSARSLSEFSARSLSMARPSALAGSSLPEYLSRAGDDIMMGRPGAYWLHGEDARERLRAVDALALRLSAGGKVSWVTAVVNLSAGASRRQARVTNELELAARRVWDAWEDLSGRPDPSILAATAMRSAAAGGRVGVAIILGEFPARKKKAAGFLDWLTSGMAMGSMPMLLFVSTESTPPVHEHSPFRSVRCETAAARLGRHVAELRLRRGWNRADLAKRVDMPQSMIREIEGGLRERWDERILRRLAVALEVNMDEFVRDIR